MMAATLVTSFFKRAPELFAYQVHHKNYESGRWVAYDQHFRREALARKDLNWLKPSLGEQRPPPTAHIACRQC